MAKRFSKSKNRTGPLVLLCVSRLLWFIGWAVIITSGPSGSYQTASLDWQMWATVMSLVEEWFLELRSATQPSLAFLSECMSPLLEGRVTWGEGWCISVEETGSWEVLVSIYIHFTYIYKIIVINFCYFWNIVRVQTWHWVGFIDDLIRIWWSNFTLGDWRKCFITK